MKYLLCLIILFLPNILFAQDLEKILAKAEQRLQARTPNLEVEDAIIYLKSRQDLAETDLQYIKFLSAYAIPEDLRQSAILTASWQLHNLVGPSNPELDEGGSGFKPIAYMDAAGVFRYVQRVPGSETLYWIDVRDYNWTPQSWEDAALLDGYFVKPVISEENDGALRILSGNAVLRMDWFIRHTSDETLQLDTDSRPFLYQNFLFANSAKPTTGDAFFKAFLLDKTLAFNRGNVSAALVTKSNAVSNHNRLLFAYRTEYGFAYESYDPKNQEGKRDYLESFFLNKIIGGPPDVFDAGEFFMSNPLGLQVYGLRDAKDNLVQFGDPTLVRHVNDVLGDVRVRNPTSCMDCHAAGPIPTENTIKEFVDAKFWPKTYLNKDKQRVKRLYLDGKFDDTVKDGQELYARALLKCNGLKPEINGQNFLKTIKWYDQDLDLAQAAYECGVSEELFKEKVSQGNYGMRLKLLVANGETIPRRVWESRGKDGIPGQFQQAMILINGFTKQEEIVHEILTLVTIKECNLMEGTKTIAKCPKNTTLEIIKEQDGWCKVKFQDKEGWIKRADLR